MRCTALLRLATWTLALVHTFPARKHLAAFFEAPSMHEAWKGFGALVAIGIYLLPVSLQARGLKALWRKRRNVLRASAVLLVVVHAVPAFDHLPRFLAAGHWEDAWRGIGASLAIGWFLAPLSLQARAIAALVRIRMPRPSPAVERRANV
jgi:hypothetical protein